MKYKAVETGSVGATVTSSTTATGTTDTSSATTTSNPSDCPEGQCLDPSNACMYPVNCFANPCDVESCGNGEICSANYCGGCHAVCTPKTETGSTASPYFDEEGNIKMPGRSEAHPRYIDCHDCGLEDQEDHTNQPPPSIYEGDPNQAPLSINEDSSTTSSKFSFSV